MNIPEKVKIEIYVKIVLNVDNKKKIDLDNLSEVELNEAKDDFASQIGSVLPLGTE